MSFTQPRQVRLDEITRFDIGHRVKFKRPASAVSSRPIISGKLVSIAEQQYIRGNMPRTGYSLTIGHQDRWGTLQLDTFGPLPANFIIDVGGEWVRRKPDWELAEELDRHADDE